MIEPEPIVFVVDDDRKYSVNASEKKSG